MQRRANTDNSGRRSKVITSVALRRIFRSTKAKERRARRKEYMKTKAKSKDYAVRWWRLTKNEGVTFGMNDAMFF